MEEIKTKSIRDAQTNTTIADSHLLNFFGSATGFFKITWANLKLLLTGSFVPIDPLTGKCDLDYLDGIYKPDVVFTTNYTSLLTETPETSVLYITEEAETYSGTYYPKGSQFFYSGTTYVQITPLLGELETTAYRGDKGKIAYDFSQGQEVIDEDSLDTVYNKYMWTATPFAMAGLGNFISGWAMGDSAGDNSVQMIITSTGHYTRICAATVWGAWDKTDKSATVTKFSLGIENVDNTSDALKPVSTATAAAIAVVQSEVDAVEVRVDALEIYPIRLYATTTNDTSVEFLDINGDRLPLQSYPYMIELRAIRTGDDLGLMSGGVFTAWGASDSDYYVAHTGGGAIPMSLSDSEAQGIWADLSTVQPKIYAKGATSTDLSWVIEVTYITTTPVS